MSDQLSDNIRLSLSWRNVSSFEGVKRLKFLHILNNEIIKEEIIKEEIITNEDQGKENYFTTTSESSQSLIVYSDIPREERIIGIHSLKLFFSFKSDDDSWLDLFDIDTNIQIRREHLYRDFALEESGILKMDPSDTQYILFNKHTSEDLFSHTVEMLKTNGSSFKLSRRDVDSDLKKWLSLNEEDGSISWVDTFDEGIALNRVSIPNDLNGEFIVLMSDSGYVLYKTEFETPKFGKLSEVSMNDSEIAFATDSEATMIEPEGGEEIRYTREELGQPIDEIPFDECNTNCLGKPTCMGVNIIERVIDPVGQNILYDDCASTTPFIGTLTGGAIRDTNNKWIVLSQHGVGDSIRTVYWPITLPRKWTCTFNWYKGTGPWDGADDVRFIFYAPNPITTSSGQIHGGGHYVLMEYWQQDTFAIRDSNHTNLTIANVGWVNNVWHPVTVTFDNGVLTVEVNNYSTIITRTYNFGTRFEDLGYYDNPTYVGFSGRTGGVSENAFIKDIRIDLPPEAPYPVQECVYYHNESGEKDTTTNVRSYKTTVHT